MKIMKYDIEWLKSEIKRNIKVEYILFWGHQPSKEGKIGKSCFSQWYNISFVVDNIKYLTAEHWMMSEKAKTFNAFELLPEILNASTPEIVKALGRKIKNFDEQIWDKCKYECVKQGNFHKFSQNVGIKSILIINR